MFEQTFKNIDDVLWKEAGCSSELDYTEQTSWMLFLKYLDDLEVERAMEAELRGQPQHEVPPYKLVWLLPFLDLYPQHALALRLQASAGAAATAYGQLGGRLAPLYPHVAR